MIPAGLLGLLLGSAQAATPILSAGLQGTFNDPFVRTQGLHLSAVVPVASRFRLGVTAGGYSSLRGNDLRPLTDQIVSQYKIAPDISRIRARALVEGQVLLLEQHIGDRARALGLHIGLGGIYTQDDSDALMVSPDDPAFAATADQLHPLWGLGVSGELWWDHLGARLRLDLTDYSEVVMSTVVEDRTPAWITAEVLWRLP